MLFRSIKVSEATAKVTTPGVLDVRRYRDAEGKLVGDMIYDIGRPPEGDAVMVDPADVTRRRSFSESEQWEDLLVPVFRGGTQVYQPPKVDEARQRAIEQIDSLDSSILRFLNPHVHPVGLERSVSDLRTALVLRARRIEPEETVPSREALAEAGIAIPADARKDV